MSFCVSWGRFWVLINFLGYFWETGEWIAWGQSECWGSEEKFSRVDRTQAYLEEDSSILRRGKWLLISYKYSWNQLIWSFIDKNNPLHFTMPFHLKKKRNNSFSREWQFKNNWDINHHHFLLSCLHLSWFFNHFSFNFLNSMVEAT